MFVLNGERYFFVKRIILIPFILLLCFYVKAQQPSHYLIGEEELLGIDVYSIVQDKVANVWLGTDAGLMRYDGYQFRTYESQEMKSRSLFGLTFDNNNILYCHSINGRIYRVINDSLELFYELPDSLVTNYIFICFDNRNRLIISSGNYYELTADKKLSVVLRSKNPEIHLLQKNSEGSVVLVDSDKNKLIGYADGESHDLAIFPRNFEDIGYFNPMFIDNKLLGVIGNSREVFQVQSKEVIPLEFDDFALKGDSYNCFFKGEGNNMWVASSTNGVQSFEVNGLSVFGNKSLFPKYRISDVYRDQEGTFWLATLGKGIILIPNHEVVDIGSNHKMNDLSLRSICKDNQNNIYVGSQEGELYRIGKSSIHSPELLRTLTSQIDQVTFLPRTKEIFTGTVLLDPNEKSFEDISLFRSGYRIKESPEFGWFIPHRTGIAYIRSDGERELESALVDFPFVWEEKTSVANMNIGRTNAVYFDVNRKTIWAATSLGLKTVTASGIGEVKLKGNSIPVSAISGTLNDVWVTSQSAGLIHFKNGKLVRQYTELDGLISDGLPDLKIREGFIYVSSKNGLQRLNPKTHVFQSIVKSNGLNSNKVIDFEVTKEYIWVLTSKGLQRFHETVFAKRKSKVIPYFIKVSANDRVLSQENEALDYTQNRLQFTFAVRGYKHRGELIYEYQLNGISDEWISLAFDDNKVVFPSLPPGNYRFKLRTKNSEGVYSKVIKYSFEIQAPFWQRWWFYALCTLIIIGVSFLVFKIRLRIITQRLILERQLKVSEIKAIKSQMNPHFVFNALNSVQDLMMMDDVRASNIYLSHFASLMRKTLEISSEQFISLEEEIEILELYLGLEKLRFGDDFKYNIDSQASENSNHRIPTMLIQPYVENAIKHGLLHKKGDKQLMISFANVDGQLVCEVRDNGVGRLKSKEINERKPFEHESFSSKANESRIDLINQTLSQKIKFEITDLFEGDIPSGTVVRFIFS